MSERGTPTDAEAYAAQPPGEDEFSSDEAALAWEGESWQDLDAKEGGTMNALKLDTMTEPDGTLTFRLPNTGRFRVHVEATWKPDEVDRRAIFDELRRRGNPDVMALLARLGEDAIVDPESLLFYGSIDDPTFERPPQPPYDQRDPIE